MSRARHRKPQRHKIAVASMIMILAASLGASETVAGLTSDSSVAMTAKSAQWRTPTVVSQGYNNATVSWDAIPGYTDYILQYSKTPNFDFPISMDVSASWSPMSTFVNRLTNGTTYYWRVKPKTSPANITWGLQSASTTVNANPTVKFGDMLAYSLSDNRLYNYGKTSQNANGSFRQLVSTGSPIPKHLYVTDWNSDGIEDVFIQNGAGTGSLEVQLGKANGGFTPLTVGYSTWNEYEATIGRWPKANSAPAILAIEKSTGSHFYYSNPSGGQHGPRMTIGNGWNNFATAIVDFDNDGNSDVIAKNTTGSLMLYRGDGGGGFIGETRQILGTNWNTMDCIGVIEDSEAPGTKGVIAREISSANLYYYPIENGKLGERRLFGDGFYNYKISGS